MEQKVTRGLQTLGDKLQPSIHPQKQGHPDSTSSEVQVRHGHLPSQAFSSTNPRSKSLRFKTEQRASACKGKPKPGLEEPAAGTRRAHRQEPRHSWESQKATHMAQWARRPAAWGRVSLGAPSSAAGGGPRHPLLTDHKRPRRGRSEGRTQGVTPPGNSQGPPGSSSHTPAQFQLCSGAVSLRVGTGSGGGRFMVPGPRGHAWAPRESGACWERPVCGCARGVRGSPVLPGPQRKSGHQNGSNSRGCPFPTSLPSLLETSLAARCHHVAEFWCGRNRESRAQ